MIITLSLISIAAIAGAFVAGSRAYKKLKIQPNYSETVQEAKLQEADRPRLQPDLDSGRSQFVEVADVSPLQAESAEVPAVSPVRSSDASTIAVPPMMPLPETEISLATSLRISDVVEPPEVEMHLSTKAKSGEHHTPSVVEEIGQLDHIEETLNQLTHQATDSDHLVRVAAAVELGELAKRGQSIDRVIALLNQLTQDADLEVQAQAGASLAMIHVEAPLD